MIYSLGSVFRLANGRSVLAVGLVAATLITVAACRDGQSTAESVAVAKSADINAKASAQAVAALPSVSPPVSYELAGRRLSLSEQSGRCWLESSANVGDKKATRNALDLSAPCFVMLWQAPPPLVQKRDSTQSDGIPIGIKGEPIAWRYPGAKGQTVVVFIGDPVVATTQPDPFGRAPPSAGARCANSMQAVLIPMELAEPVKLSTTVADVGGLCAESGMDEKTFWLFAHR